MRSTVVNHKLAPYGRKPREVLDLLDKYVAEQIKLNEPSDNGRDKFFPTQAIYELMDRGVFKRELTPDEIRSYSQTINNLAKNKLGLLIGTNKEAHATEAVQVIKEVLQKLTEELKKEDKIPKDCKVYSTLFAETLSKVYKVKIHAAAFRRAALRAGFQMANGSEAQILTSETEELKRLKDWIRNKKKELEDKGIDPKTYKVFVTELKRELKLSTGKTNIKEIVLREGLSVAGQSEAQIKVHQTPGTTRIREHLQDLKRNLKVSKITPENHTIYPAALARQLGLDEDSYTSVIRYIAQNEGFKTADLSESQIDAKQTPETKLIRDYFKDLKTKLKSIDCKPEEILIYPTEVANHLELNPAKHRPSIIHIAQAEHFQTANISKARKRAFKIKKGNIDLAVGGFPGVVINPNLEQKYGKTYEKYLEPVERVLDLLHDENPFAYKIFSLHAGFQGDPMTDKEIAIKLKLDKDNINQIISSTLRWVQEKLKDS